MSQCKARTEVYSRIVGYFRPVQQWNIGKREEYETRREFVIDPAAIAANAEIPAAAAAHSAHAAADIAM